MLSAALLLAALSEAGSAEDPVLSLLGKPLAPPAIAADRLKVMEADLAAARRDLDKDPKNVDLFVWVGRRLGYLGRYGEAIAFLQSGLQPGKLSGSNVEAKLLRHIGHRYLTIRKLQEAENALTRALSRFSEPDEVEPDGIPNDRNIPIGSLKSNILYHLGLSQYLLGKFEAASRTYEACQTTSSNPDRLVSTTYWQALALARLGDRSALEKALEPIHAKLDVIENDSYLRLLLHFKGDLSEAAILQDAAGETELATVGYGVAAWRLHKGKTQEALALLRQVAQGKNWAPFGVLAAEAELKRLGSESDKN